MKARTWVVFTALATALAGCGQSEAGLSAARNPNELKADDVVAMGDDSYGCESQSQLAQALEHRNKSELTAWAKIVNNNPWCFYSPNLKAGQTWTVLQIDGAVMQIGQTTLAQYELDPSRHKRSYWTATKWGSKASR